jgi:hypothetical protein
MKRFVRMFLVLVAAGDAAITRASAQSVSYLLPNRYELASGSEVEVRVASGESGLLQTIPWPGRDLQWLFVRTAGTQRNFAEATPGRPGEDFVRVALSEPDVAMIGMDRRPWIERVPGAEMRRFLELDVEATTLPVDWKARTTSETVRVRHIESAKLLVRIVKSVPEGREEWRGSATAPSKTGQRSEIRPLIDPTAMAVGSDLPLRISWSDSAGVDATIVARHPVTGTRHASLARGGAGWFTVTAPGEWRVEIHRAKLLGGDPAADWELETATLSFVVPAASKPAGGGK